MKKMQFPSEKFIEDYVCGKIEKTGRCPILGIPIQKHYRQEKVGAYGVPDLIYIDKCAISKTFGIIIVELKNEPLKAKHVEQALRYRAGVDHYVRLNKRIFGDYSVNTSAVLAGPMVSSDIVFVPKYIDNLRMFEISCCVDDGFKSDEVGDSWYKTAASKKDCNGAIKQYFNHMRDRKKAWGPM